MKFDCTDKMMRFLTPTSACPCPTRVSVEQTTPSQYANDAVTSNVFHQTGRKDIRMVVPFGPDTRDPDGRCLAVGPACLPGGPAENQWFHSADCENQKNSIQIRMNLQPPFHTLHGIISSLTTHCQIRHDLLRPTMSTKVIYTIGLPHETSLFIVHNI